MTRLLRHALLVLLLLFSQQAAQLHALGHALVQVGGGSFVALGDSAVEGGTTAPASSHPAEHCLAFHAIDSALPGVALPPIATCGAATSLAFFTLPPPFATRVVFDSRAPPVLS